MPSMSSFEGNIYKGIILLSTAYVLRVIDDLHMGLRCDWCLPFSRFVTFRGFAAVQAPSIITLDTPPLCETKAELELREKLITQLRTYL